MKKTINTSPGVSVAFGFDYYEVFGWKTLGLPQFVFVDTLD